MDNFVDLPELSTEKPLQYQPFENPKYYPQLSTSIVDNYVHYLPYGSSIRPEEPPPHPRIGGSAIDAIDPNGRSPRRR
ncbi:hypothetical protein [Bifidobacterium phasiani]|uniref:Uncharacterized protein n=1 Tax=Bifidobacterium phasiani TaxID=2834431 RepID=A0ABS6W6T9_9BIFI|nr:hypothetical protein [Bifidobacterium phasiani]MBW3082204.1 hypothetical protein [Bifidobacterium phasiani]